MKYIVIFIFALCLTLLSCSDQSENQCSFYYWKSNASLSQFESSVLQDSRTDTIYLHYFDVDVVEQIGGRSGNIYPAYPLKNVDEGLKSFEIVPVIFITNRAFEEITPAGLAGRIETLTNQISDHHFGKRHKQIQIDCDWTNSTRDDYFELLELLKKSFDVSVTIRLHQLKYMDKTGIPPVARGSLMLYNVGDLKNEHENSILESEIVSQYITPETTYPMQLDVALPLFSQTVIKNLQGDVKLVNRTERQLLEANTKCFTQVEENLFKVRSDTLYRGFYLSQGFLLKLEELSESEVIKSYKLVENSNLNLNSVIFYHLDERLIQATDFKHIREEI